jgi:hypothetical protein
MAEKGERKERQGGDKRDDKKGRGFGDKRRDGKGKGIFFVFLNNFQVPSLNHGLPSPSWADSSKEVSSRPSKKSIDSLFPSRVRH